MSEPFWIDCASATDIPAADRLRELVTDERHVVLRFPSVGFAPPPADPKSSWVEYFASALPEFAVFESGGSHDTEQITVSKVISTKDVLANEAEFVAALRLFRQTASTLATRLAQHLGVPADHLLELGMGRARAGWADQLRGLLGRRLRGHRLDQEWHYWFHGGACRFESRATGQIVEVRLTFGKEFGVLDPYFFAQFVKSTAALAPLSRLLRDDFHDASRVLSVLDQLGHLRRVEGRFLSGVTVREEEEQPARSIEADPRNGHSPTESEVRACTTPMMLLELLRRRGKLSERKARLFAVACCRRIWPLLIDARSRAAVETAEQLAEEFGEEGRRPSRTAALAAGEEAIAQRQGSRWEKAAYAAYHALARSAAEAAERASHFAAEAKGEEVIAPLLGKKADLASEYRTAVAVESKAQVALLSCLFGDVFHPLPAIDSGSRAWNDGLIVKLAQAAYKECVLPEGTLERDRLAVLADALEEAGACNSFLMDHLRGPGSHVRGCCVLDAILGKT
ncbi:MAG TPA: hypothetical protein VH643_06600 [Gemmataceae bacterium]|jgi:hypothetical protein